MILRVIINHFWFQVRVLRDNNQTIKRQSNEPVVDFHPQMFRCFCVGCKYRTKRTIKRVCDTTKCIVGGRKNPVRTKLESRWKFYTPVICSKWRQSHSVKWLTYIFTINSFHNCVHHLVLVVKREMQDKQTKEHNHWTLKHLSWWSHHRSMKLAVYLSVYTHMFTLLSLLQLYLSGCNIHYIAKSIRSPALTHVCVQVPPRS